MTRHSPVRPGRGGCHPSLTGDRHRDRHRDRHTPSPLADLPRPRPTELPPEAVLVGVDTHKAAHVAVAITALGGRIAACRAPADRDG